MSATDTTAIAVEEVASHRNGVGGESFHVVKFTDLDEGLMLGILFPERDHVAVFQRQLLGLDEIGFAANSYRGDVYEPALRQAVSDYEAGRGGVQADGMVCSECRESFAYDPRHKYPNYCQGCSEEQDAQDAA